MLEYDDLVVAMNEVIKKYKFPIHNYRVVENKNFREFSFHDDALEENIVKDILAKLNMEVDNLDIKSLLCELIRPKISYNTGREIVSGKYEIIAYYNNDYSELDTKLIKEFIDECNG